MIGLDGAGDGSIDSLVNILTIFNVFCQIHVYPSEPCGGPVRLLQRRCRPLNRLNLKHLPIFQTQGGEFAAPHAAGV